MVPREFVKEAVGCAGPGILEGARDFGGDRKAMAVGICAGRVERIWRLGPRPRLSGKRTARQRPGQSERRRRARPKCEKDSLRSFSRTAHVPNLQRCGRSNRVQRPPFAERKRSGEIFELAGNPSFSKRQSAFRIALLVGGFVFGVLGVCVGGFGGFVLFVWL